jgi:RNA polymerase primary sigma factor
MKQIIINPTVTTREYESLGKYFREIEKFFPVKPEEEVTLAEKIRLGDQRALERLTKANLKFVISVAKQYQHMGLSLGDLINEGNMGLIVAAKRYDESRGFKFISYAVWWIRQAIISALAEHARTIRLPYNKIALQNRVYKVIARLEQDLGRKPSVEEIGENIGIAAVKVMALLDRSEVSLSLDAPVSKDDDYSLGEMLPHPGARPDDDVMAEAVKTEIRCALRVVSEREREILILYFGLGHLGPMALEDIANRFGITKEHIGRLKEGALRKLRNCSSAGLLLSCLG